jgi:plastocyanin
VWSELFVNLGDQSKKLGFGYNLLANKMEAPERLDRALVGILLVISVGVIFTAGLTQSLKNSASASLARSSTTAVTYHGTTVIVTIQNGAGDSSSLGFFPTTITVVLGVNSSVKWTNEDYSIHTATANDGAFDSGNIDPGTNFTYVFTTAGTYSYHCDYHVWMKGTIIVLAGSS